MSASSIPAPTDLRDFLRADGWEVLAKALQDRLFVLNSQQHPKRQLVFPMDEAAPDYADSVHGVIQKLAEVKNLSPANVLARIQVMRDDVVSFRVISRNNESTLPLGYASNLVANTEKLLKAAACTVLRPRVHHPRLSLNEATELANNARFQQTEKGSFVIKVACPVDLLDIQPSLQLGVEHGPFVRQAVLGFYRAVNQLVEAIETDTLADLTAQVKKDQQPLISSNLCEAIAAMWDDTLDNGVDIGVAWSMLYPMAESTYWRPIQVKRDFFPRIAEVQRELCSVETPVDDTYYGTVERLDGDLDANGQRSGEVVIALLLPDTDEVVRARLSLSAKQYQQAIEAHKTGNAYVRVKGRLNPGRQPRQLVNVAQFERC